MGAVETRSNNPRRRSGRRIVSLQIFRLSIFLSTRQKLCELHRSGAKSPLPSKAEAAITLTSIIWIIYKNSTLILMFVFHETSETACGLHDI